MKNFIQQGAILTAIAAADVTSGDGVLIGALFGVTQTTAKTGEDISLVTEGVFELPKTSAQAWAVGDKIYWSDTTKKATTAGSGNTLVGVAVEVAANPSGSGVLKLTGQV